MNVKIYIHPGSLKAATGNSGDRRGATPLQALAGL